MSSLTMLDAIKETERIGKEYTDRKVQEAAGNGGGGSAGNYPPYSGIPRDDLSRDVRNSLELADSALQPGVAETTYQKKGNYPTKTEMTEAIAAAQMGAGSGAPVNATAIKYTPEGGEETTVAEALTLLSEDIVALNDKVAVSAAVSDGVATFKNSKGQNLFTMNIPTGSGNVSGMTETQVRTLINTYNFATKSELPASWTEQQIRNIITGYGYGTYSKPSGGIPESDLSQEVRNKLNGGTVSGSGVTIEQAESLYALISVIPFPFDVTGLKDSFCTAWGIGNEEQPAPTLTSITASYSGGSVVEGTETNALGIVVTGNYSDGTSSRVYGFSLSPSVISVGANNITVTYQGKTATVSVTGTAKPVETPTLSSITATYSGGDVEEGTAVSALTGIVVTGHYSDGSTIPVSGWTASGTIGVGENVITISYSGKTTTITVVGTSTSSEPDVPTDREYIHFDVTYGKKINSKLTALQDDPNYCITNGETIDRSKTYKVDWRDLNDGTTTYKRATSLWTINNSGKYTKTGPADNVGTPIDATEIIILSFPDDAVEFGFQLYGADEYVANTILSRIWKE